MALPLDSRTLNNVVSTTLDAKKPRVVDLFFKSNPLLVRLYSRGNVKWDGGDKIRVPFLYAGLGGGSYGKGDTFDTSTKEFITDLIFDWKRNYAPMAMDQLDTAKNQGVSRIIDLVDAMMQNARMTLADNIGTQIQGDGTGNGGKDMDGLANAISTTLAYGGITRDTSAIGSAIKGNVNTTGGAFSLTQMNTEFGNAVIGNEKPDLIVTTQTIWNKFWERIQPQQRFASEDLKNAGMAAIQFNGADVVVDSHVAGGSTLFLNTKYLEFWIMQGYDFKTRGPFDVYNQDAWVGQMVLYSNLVCTSPRLQDLITNVT